MKFRVRRSSYFPDADSQPCEGAEFERSTIDDESKEAGGYWTVSVNSLEELLSFVAHKAITPGDAVAQIVLTQPKTGPWVIEIYDTCRE